MRGARVGGDGMKVSAVKCDYAITICPIADRWYTIPNGFRFELVTDIGRKIISVDAGFCFDGRSGGPMVDALGVAPNLGTQAELKAWLLHDINYYDCTGLSFEESNDMLYQMLRECGYSWIRARLVYNAVQWFGASSFGEPSPDSREYCNMGKIHVRHYDK